MEFLKKDEKPGEKSFLEKSMEKTEVLTEETCNPSGEKIWREILAGAWRCLLFFSNNKCNF